MTVEEKRFRILTWHVHGSYLYYLSQGNFQIFLPTHEKKTEGYVGRGTTFPFGDNVVEVPAADVKNLGIDCILLQSRTNYEKDQFEILSPRQRRLPKFYLEHDPPRESPTDTRHPVTDPDVTIVHVTNFNKLMWDCNGVPTRVIEHGVIPPRASYTGLHDKGVVVINNLSDRGRRLGLDIFLEARKRVPLDLIGMESEKLGGTGEILHPQMSDYLKNFRFFFNPIRYTSLGLAVIEAMMTGLPVVALATTEMATLIEDGVSGYIHTDLEYLIEKMKILACDRELAATLGARAKAIALERFNIARFTQDWYRLFDQTIGKTRVHQPRVVTSET